MKTLFIFLTPATLDLVRFALLLPVGQWVYDKSRVPPLRPAVYIIRCNILYMYSFKTTSLLRAIRQIRVHFKAQNLVFL